MFIISILVRNTFLEMLKTLQGYKIIVANDIPLTLANIELIKSLTKEEDVISYKTLEGDKTGKQTRLELELTGKYIVVMTFAKKYS